MIRKQVRPGRALAITALLVAGGSSAVADQQHVTLSPLVITAPPMSDPYSISTDTRQPRLPLPAHDGGSYLKSIPGFSVSRKGGTSGDPELRGLGGSRLNILMNGSHILGGCGGRMDPPTAYVFPQAYDRIEIIKGPQSVRYGPAPAGVVRFERDSPVLTEPTVQGFASMTVGRFERIDTMADVTAGDRLGYVRVIGTLSDQDDYKDGDGERVHSNYNRWSTTGILGWTPDQDTRVEFTYDRSDGRAAYDDRGMDGTLFDRTGYQLSFNRRNLAPWLAEIEATAYYNYVDHVMDNFTLREPPNMPAVGFPDRRTVGGRLTADITLGPDTWIHTGVDYAENTHANNLARGADAFGWRDLRREDNATFNDIGVFTEVEQALTARSWVTMGLRMDRSEVEAEKEGFGGVGAGETETSTLWSGFARYELALQRLPVNLFAGVGHAERSADFWERRRVFDLDDEKLTQVDLGASWSTGRISGSLSMFYGWMDDYILIVQPGLEDIEARNIDASMIGGEADLTVVLTDAWNVTGTVAYVRSKNDTDNVPLAQTPPLQGTLSLDYARGRYYAGTQLRAVARQDRIHPGYGTIYSLDTGETPGFATVSAYAGTELFRNTRLTLGVDNLFDRTYAEHIQRGAADLGASDTPINEPEGGRGRTSTTHCSG